MEEYIPLGSLSIIICLTFSRLQDLLDDPRMTLFLRCIPLCCSSYACMISTAFIGMLPSDDMNQGRNCLYANTHVGFEILPYAPAYTKHAETWLAIKTRFQYQLPMDVKI